MPMFTSLLQRFIGQYDIDLLIMYQYLIHSSFLNVSQITQMPETGSYVSNKHTFVFESLLLALLDNMYAANK